MILLMIRIVRLLSKLIKTEILKILTNNIDI